MPAEAKEPKSKRAELTAMMDEMRAEETNAVKDLKDLFKSDATKAFNTQLLELRERTVPGSHFDQIIGSALRVMESIMSMAEQAEPVTMAAPAAGPAPAPSTPAPKTEKA